MDYDAIVIGTGFGATVAATQLAGKGKRTLMLERGVWWFTPERPIPDYIKQRSQGDQPEQPVQYWPRPNNSRGLVDFLSVVRTNSPLENARQIGDFFRGVVTGNSPPQPLYRYNMFDEIHIVTASGVGGGSLVYSNVSLEPKWDEATQRHPVMDGWPLRLNQQDYQAAWKWMTDYRGKPQKVVTRVPLPRELNLDVDNLSKDYDGLYLKKSFALRRAAQEMGADWQPLKLQIAELDEMTNEQSNSPSGSAANPFCERQGRCFLGCLPGARHTLNKTILQKLLTGANPLVALKSMVEVKQIQARDGDGYNVIYTDLRNGSDQSVQAPVVILASGVLGTTKILLRSQDGLTFSDALGSRFSSNGDFGGFVVVPQTPPIWPIYPTRGPINTSHVMFQDGNLHMTIEDGAIPSMFASTTAAALNVLGDALQQDLFLRALRGFWLLGQFSDLRQFLSPNPSDPAQFQTEDEMLAHVFFFNCMGTDDARGKFSLDGDKLTLGFPGGSLADHPVFQKIEGILRTMAGKMGGNFIPFPLWQGFADRKIVTVHPLGGCPMGNSSTDGAVDGQGRVFNTRSGSNTVHKGLFVADASIIPGPLAVNPTLTIVAMALKIASQIA